MVYSNLSDNVEDGRIGFFEVRRQQLLLNQNYHSDIIWNVVSTFCWPSVDNARVLCDTKDLAVTGRLHARQSNEPDVLAVARNDDMAYVGRMPKGRKVKKNNGEGVGGG